jgi:hypothetical protein
MSTSDTMTLADHAEAWARESGQPVPERATPEWGALYTRWRAFAFAGFADGDPEPEYATREELAYRAAPYGLIARIPKGTGAEPATNLPDAGRFWARPWPGMTERAQSWHRNYGFLLGAADVITIQPTNPDPENPNENDH